LLNDSLLYRDFPEVTYRRVEAAIRNHGVEFPKNLNSIPNFRGCARFYIETLAEVYQNKGL
jgi:hypothetical protein